MLPFFYRCLQILLEQGAAVNTATQSGDTPLHLAVDGGHLACCRLLLHHGADIILPGAVSHLQLMRDGRSGSLVMLTLEAIQWQILLFRMSLMLLSQTISSLFNLFCTDIWLNSWKQIISNWHSKITLICSILSLQQTRRDYSIPIMSWPFICNPLLFAERRTASSLPHCVSVCVPRLCPDTVFWRYQMHLPLNRFSLSVHNTLAQCMHTTFIKVYSLDKTRIRPLFLLSHHLLPKAPI